MKKYTLQEKISKTFILVSTCILLIITILMSAIISKVYWNKSYKLCEQLVNLNLDLLNNQIIQVQKTQKILAKNVVVRDAVNYFREQQERNYLKELEFHRSLNDVFYLLAENAAVDNAYIIDSKGDYIYFYKEALKQNYNMLDEEWYKSLIDSIYMDTSYVSGLHDRKYLVNETDEKFISMVMPIQDNIDFTFSAEAFLVCDINLGSILNNNSKDNMHFAILAPGGELYSDETLDLDNEEKEKIISLASEGEGHVQILHRSLFTNSIVVSMKSQVFGWKVIGVKELQEIRDLNMILIVIMGITMIVAILLVLFVSKRVSRSLLLPMNRLIDWCDRVAAGDQNVVFKEEKSKEISFLYKTIESMVNNIVHLSEQVVDEEKKLSEEKLKVLQHQINPHFLNNVLQTIKALAVSGETDKISKMSTLLGKILVNSVYQPYQKVELEIELGYLKNYIELQNIRFDNKIFYSIDCEEEVKKVMIPKLTLQPLVENAIDHGYKHGSNLMINISAEVDQDMICIIINDNGQGIPKEELEKIKERLRLGKTYQQESRIGVVNVNERLKKMFGEEYGVEILSKGYGGTTVIVRIPKDEEGI